MTRPNTLLPSRLAGVRRIAFLGDDLTDAGIYPACVANTLSRLWPDAGFEFVNAGLAGASVDDVKRSLAANLFRVGPELVIVGFGRAAQARPGALDELEDEIRGCGARVLTIRPCLPADPEAAARRVLEMLECGDVELEHGPWPDPHGLIGWEPAPSCPGDDGEAVLEGSVRRLVFECAEAGARELQLGGRHPMAVWLNGARVWCSVGPLGVHPNAERLDVKVRQGANELTVQSAGPVFAGLRPIEPFLRVDGHALARVATPMGETHRTELERRDRINADVLAKLDALPAGGRLTGTFIYAHALGYRSRCTLGYGVSEWRALFRELKELGMDTAVMGTAAVIGSRECFYPSRLFREFETWNVIEPMLAAAGEEKMTVYLGGIGVSETLIGAETGDEGLARSCADRELACYRELATRYKGAFHGYYLASETGFWSWGNPDYLTRCFRTYFQRVTNGVKAITPELPILGSPYTVRCPGREQEAIDTLAAVHAGCPFTALAPQDSIGVSMNELSFLEKGLAIWKTVCQGIGAEFWVNCETFNIEDFGGPLHTIVPADFKRLSIQLDTAERMGARKLITWEAIHFMNPAGSPAARRLRADYLRHRPAVG